MKLVKLPIQSKRTTLIRLLLVLGLLSSWVLFSKIERTKFHGDETGWSASGDHYSNLLLTLDFIWEKWKCAKCIRVGRENV